MLAAWPVTLKLASVPPAAGLTPNMAFRALATVPPGNSRLTAQYDPENVAVLPVAGAGMATNRSKVLSVDSVLDPTSPTGLNRAFSLSPERSGLSIKTNPAGSTL